MSDHNSDRLTNSSRNLGAPRIRVNANDHDDAASMQANDHSPRKNAIHPSSLNAVEPTPTPTRQGTRSATSRGTAGKTRPAATNFSSPNVLFVPENSNRSASRRPSSASSGAGAKSAGSAGSALKKVVAVLVAVIVLVALIVFISSRVRSCSAAKTTAATADQQPSRVSFVAVGDNLPNDVIGEWADAQAGEVGDGKYDYSSIYEPIKEYIQNADLAYCKEETHCGGDELGAKGYPSFNTTDAMADALVSTGFDLVASASNHCYDWGSYGANDHSCSLWSTKDVTFTGTYTNETAYNTIATTTKNGITFSLLDYTYGVNGYDQSELPSNCVKFIDEELIRSDVAKAQQISDVVIVAMHWGTENQTAPDEEQLKYAQLLADLGVDVILGSHPHVIGPLAWIEGANGNKTLCAYSLGNFLSAHETPHELNELEGMLSCTFVREKANDAVTIQDVTWTPLVNHTTETTYAVYALKDYTESLAAAHIHLGGNGAQAISSLRSTDREVVNSLGFTFEIDDEPQIAASPSPSAKRSLFL